MAAPSSTIWGSVSSNGKGKLGLAISASTTNTTVTLTVAVWLALKYNIDDSSNKYYFSYTNDSGTTVTSPNGTSLDLDFGITSGSGWSDSSQKLLGTYTLSYTKKTSSRTIDLSSKLTGLGSDSYSVSVSTTYTIPALPTYTVSYNGNGGSDAPDAQTKYYGIALTLSKDVPTRSGYTFMGWSTANDTSVEYASEASYTSNSSVTLYAVWRKTLTLSYNANGGSGAPSAQSGYIYNSTTSYKFTISSTKPTKSGYTFMGWSVANDTTAEYSSGGSITISANTTLYAVWRKTLTLTYDANGGSNAPSAQSGYAYNSDTDYEFTVPSATPTRSGYTFMGWGTSASDTSANYSSGDKVTITANKTLYAVWRKTLTLSYSANGGSDAPASQKGYVYNSDTDYKFTVSSTTPTKKGHTFIGWGTSSDDETVNYAGGSAITISENTTLYAVWAINNYDLIIVPNGGTWGGSVNNTTKNGNYGSTLEIANPVWTGHTFTGWSLNGGGSLSGTTYTYGDGDATLTANWDTNEYPIIYDASTNGGTVNGKDTWSETIDYGSYASLPSAVRKNYVFVGWYTAPNGGELVTSLTVTGATTLYARFEIDASVYVKVNGAWKSGVAFAKDTSGNMNKGYAKVNNNGTWKDGFC